MLIMKKKVTILLILLVLMSSLPVYGATTSDEEVKPKTVIVIYDTIEAVMKEYSNELKTIENNYEMAKNRRTLTSNRISGTENDADALDAKVDGYIDDLEELILNDPTNLAAISALNMTIQTLSMQRAFTPTATDSERRQLSNSVKMAEFSYEINKHKAIKDVKTQYMQLQRLRMQKELLKEMVELMEKSYRRNNLRKDLGLISKIQWDNFLEQFNKTIMSNKNLDIGYNQDFDAFKIQLGLDLDTEIMMFPEIPQPDFSLVSLGHAMLNIKEGYQLQMLKLDLDEKKQTEREQLDRRGSSSLEYKNAKMEWENAEATYNKVLNFTETRILSSFQQLQNKRITSENQKQLLVRERELYKTRELQYKLGLISLEELENAKIGLLEKEINYNNDVMDLVEGINNFYALSLGVE